MSENPYSAPQTAEPATSESKTVPRSWLDNPHHPATQAILLGLLLLPAIIGGLAYLILFLKSWLP
jgi:hypothetical protein